MNGHIHFFPSITYLSLNLLEPSLFLGCTLISVMSFNMSSVEDRNTPEYLNFFWSTYFHKESGSAAIAKKKKKGFVALTQTGCAMHTLSVWCSLKTVELLFRHGTLPQWSVCMPGEDTQGAGGHCQNTLCKLQPAPSSSGETWEHTGTEPKNCSGKRISLYLGLLSSSALPLWYLPILF